MIKTIGDEVLFVADDPLDAARIALAWSRPGDAEFPEVRVGLAYGDVVSRLGDVYGPVVNLASRLTSVARPGRVLVDRAMRDVLRAARRRVPGPPVPDDDGPRLPAARHVAAQGAQAAPRHPLLTVRSGERERQPQHPAGVLEPVAVQLAQLPIR